MVYEGSPQNQALWFWSGDLVYVYRTVTIFHDGVEYVRCYMILNEQVEWRYQIDTKSIEEGGDIDYRFGEFGVLIREYKASYKHVLSDTAENPVAFMFCNFDGTAISSEQELVKAKNQITALKAELGIANIEISKLRTLLMNANDRLNSFKGVK